MGDAGDASRRLGDLLALAVGDPALLREAIGKLDREDAGELLLAAVLRSSTLEAAEAAEAAASLDAAEAGERDPDESRADDAEELPVDDPFADRARPYSSTLDLARQLRMALEDQRDLSGLLNAHRALSDEENSVIVLELALARWLGRGGAEADREDRG